MECTEVRIVSPSYIVFCHECGFKSAPHKLYYEVESNKRGRKASTLNRALGIALLQSSLGASGFHELLLILGVDPGHKQGLHKLMQQCSNSVEKVTRDKIEIERQRLAKKCPSDKGHREA